MAVAKIKDLRALPRDELQKRLGAYRREMLELGDNPKKGMNLKKAIARILTLLNESNREARENAGSGERTSRFEKAPAKAAAKPSAKKVK